MNYGWGPINLQEARRVRAVSAGTGVGKAWPSMRPKAKTFSKFRGAEFAMPRSENKRMVTKFILGMPIGCPAFRGIYTWGTVGHNEWS